MMYKLEYTNMREIVKSVKICFDPKLKQTHIKEDEEFLKQYNEFQSFMNECAGVEEEEIKIF